MQDYFTIQTIKCEQIVNVALLHFIIKQLQLLFKTKEGRRLSTTLITIAILWQLTSTSLYKKLKAVFILPSSSRLRAYSSSRTVESGSMDLSYLQQQMTHLSARKRIVTLLKAITTFILYFQHLSIALQRMN